MYSALIAAFAVAVILTLVAVALGRRGPWGTGWTMFLVLFFALWLVALYVRSVGPLYFGIAWLPIAVAGILLSLLLTLALPDANHWRDESIGDVERKKAMHAPERVGVPRSGAGRFFWILILLMIMAIMVGMMNPQAAL